MGDSNQTRILWRQVWGVAAMLAAVLFSLLLYALYQPLVLMQLGFATGSLGLMQGLLAAGLEPLVGNYSDQILRRVGQRLPQITVGVTLTGLLFVVLSLLLRGQIAVQLRWTIPVVMTLWLIALITFRGPVAALLMQLAPTSELPKANAVLVLVLGLVAAVAPLLQLKLMYFGASVSFMVGAGVLLLGAFAFYRSAPSQTRLLNQLSTPSLHCPSRRRLGLISILVFLTGLAVAVETALLLQLFPHQLNATLPQWRTELIKAALLLICAAVAVPLERMTIRWGAASAMQVGVISIAGLLTLSQFNLSISEMIIVLLLLGIALGLVFISTIPFALAALPPQQAGLSTGLYFGGSGAATALVAALPKVEPNTGMSVFWLLTSGLLAVCCLAVSKYLLKIFNRK